MSPIEYSINPDLFINSGLPCIELSTRVKGKTDLHRENCFIAAFANGLPPENISITAIMLALEDAINKACRKMGLPKVHSNAFNNARGSWFESLVIVTLWNLRVDHPEFHSSLLVKLPNVTIMKFIDLFEPKAHRMLRELEESLQSSGVNLVTSNPDILSIRDLEGIDTTQELMQRYDRCTQECMTCITNAYTKILGKCKYNSIRFGLALKSSTRPDRRLQIPHEGSILKAINAHLQTRFWDSSHQIYYYAATASQISSADVKAFKTAATHSITDVNVRPMPAVDKSFYLMNLSNVKDMYEECMSRE